MQACRRGTLKGLFETCPVEEISPLLGRFLDLEAQWILKFPQMLDIRQFDESGYAGECRRGGDDIIFRTN